MERPSNSGKQKTFGDRVVEITLSIPKGRVSTYGRIARAAGGGGISAQSVTSILAKARERDGAKIPFHRIVYADGRVWMSPRHRAEREKLYKKEGIVVDRKGRIENFERVLLEFR